MSAQLEWSDDARRAIICHLHGEFDVMTYAVLEGELPLMVRSVSHEVDVIFCLHEGATLPPLAGLLREIEILLNVMPANLRYFVGVGEAWWLSNALAITLANLVKPLIFRQYRTKIRIAKSIEVAVRRSHTELIVSA